VTLRPLVGLMAGALIASPSYAQGPSRPSVRFGGFVDVYYAWDFGRSASIDRSFTTQPARHNEFNVNLAFLEARLTGERVRGRLALQAGTSVQANYGAEPALGSISGPSLNRHLQEAYVGLRLARVLWADAGVFFSHIGQEGWISRDNPTYSRSFIADYTPYYSSGVKLTWQVSPSLVAQLHLVNGWQNISESNGDKSAGVRLEYVVSPGILVGYSNFIGNELPDSVPGHVRFFHEGFGRAKLGRTTWWLTLDYGRQDTDRVDGASWFGGSLIGQVPVSSRVTLNGRVERYSDPNQVIVATGLPYGLRSWSVSLGVDLNVAEALWRTEVRGMMGDDPLWPDGKGPLVRGGAFVVTSLGLGF
jgi:hypothetical protein